MPLFISEDNPKVRRRRKKKERSEKGNDQELNGRTTQSSSV